MSDNQLMTAAALSAHADRAGNCAFARACQTRIAAPQTRSRQFPVKTRLEWMVCGMLALTVVISCPLLARASEFAIKITFDQIFDRVEPSPMLTTTRQEIAATLSSSGEVTHSERHVRNGAEIAAIDTTMRLGKSEALEWRVIDGNTLANSKEYQKFRADDPGKNTATRIALRKCAIS